MKKLLFILAIFALSMSVFAQRTITLAVDTLQGAETVSFASFEVTSGKTFVVQGLCTQLGGTSDGTLALYGSIDGTNYSFINGVGADVITASPQASITGTDLAPYRHYKIVGVGTSGDTTKVALKYMFR